MTTVALPPKPPLSPQLQAYIDAIAQVGVERESALVSIIVFGSVVTGGYAADTSDIDMVLVLRDDASPAAGAQLREQVEQLEVSHGFRRLPEQPPGRLDRFALKVTANVRSFFMCTRADLLSGEVRRILGISSVQAAFVDRVVVPSIISSAATVWGEDLLQRVPVQPIRRVDVFKAFFGLANQILLTAAMYPFVPSATKYAMGALKRSVHNCYFCYHLVPAPLADEIAFFQERLGPGRTLDELLRLRTQYRRSFSFVVRCLPAMARLHLSAALHNSFPRGSRDLNNDLQWTV